jgi:hypothetical protein
VVQGLGVSLDRMLGGGVDGHIPGRFMILV